MNIANIKLSEIAQHMADDDYHVLKIDQPYSHSVLVDKVKQVLCQYEVRIKDNYPHYKGIGLQYDDENNPFYDVLNTITAITMGDDKPNFLRKLGGKYLKRNAIGEKFPEIYDYFNQILYLIRGRILISEPGNQIRRHTDGKCSSTLHYAIQTNPGAKIIIDDNVYNIPADGYFYLINASRPHYIVNESAEDRIHIVFPINPACFKKLTQDQVDKMQKYFQQFNLDFNSFKHIQISEG